MSGSNYDIIVDSNCSLCKFTLWKDEAKSIVLSNASVNKSLGGVRTGCLSLWSLKQLFAFSSAANRVPETLILFQRAATPAATCHMQWQAPTSMHANVIAHTLAGEHKHANMHTEQKTPMCQKRIQEIQYKSFVVIRAILSKYKQSIVVSASKMTVKSHTNVHLLLSNTPIVRL